MVFFLDIDLLEKYIAIGLLSVSVPFLIFNSDPNPTEMIDYSSGKGTRYDDLGRDIKVDEFQHHGEFGITFKIVA